MCCCYATHFSAIYLNGKSAQRFYVGNTIFLKNVEICTDNNYYYLGQRLTPKFRPAPPTKTKLFVEITPI